MQQTIALPTAQNTRALKQVLASAHTHRQLITKDQSLTRKNQQMTPKICNENSKAFLMMPLQSIKSQRTLGLMDDRQMKNSTVRPPCWFILVAPRVSTAKQIAQRLRSTKIRTIYNLHHEEEHLRRRQTPMVHIRKGPQNYRPLFTRG